MKATVHELGLAGAALSLLVAAAVLPLDAPPLSWMACPLKAATGLPCLFCGCTHAFHHAVRGEMAAAFGASPLGALLAIGSALLVIWTALRLLGMPAPRLPQVAAPRRLRLLVALGLAANWAWLAARP